MTRNSMILSEKHPAGGDGSSGAKRERMTEEEILRQRERLKSTSDKVKNEASTFTARWITDQLGEYGFDSDDGPFSEAEMNGDPVWVICTECYLAIHNGEWRWPENRKLSTQMIQIAKSRMAHRVRDFMKRDKAKDNLPTSQMTYTQQMQMEEAAGQWELEYTLRDLGYEIAATAVADDPLLLRYLEVLYQLNCYDLMAEKLGMEEREVIKLERKLLKSLAKL